MKGIVDHIIDQIQDMTGKTPGLVSNLKGTISDTAKVAAAQFPQEWYVLRVPGTSLPDLRTFLNTHTNDRYPVAEMNAVAGTASFPSGSNPEPNFIYGFLTHIDISGATELPMNLIIPGGSASVYLDDGLLGQIVTSGTVRANLTQGSYNLIVLVANATGPISITLPQSIKTTRTEQSPTTPEWRLDPVAQYLEPANGSYQVNLEWDNDPKASEWQVYRTDGVAIIAPATITLPSLSQAILTYSTGVPDLAVGAELLTDTFRVGRIDSIAITQDGTGVTTATVVNVAVHSEAPTTTGGWAGRSYYVSGGRFNSIGRVTYAGTPTIKFTDTNVRGKLTYFYRISAFSLLTSTAESDLSRVMSIYVVDTTAPGSVTFNSTTGVTKNTDSLTFRFVAPNDTDYRATQVYQDVSGTLTLITTEPGLPGQPDSVTFVPPTAGLYRLLTIDWAGNRQVAGGGVTYTFDGNFASFNEGTSVNATFNSAGNLIINVVGPTATTLIRAEVSTSASPTDAAIDASTLSAAASMASLTTPSTYAVGTMVYVAVRAYIAGVGQRSVRMQIERATAAGSVAIGPNIEVRVSHASGVSTISYVATGTVTVSYGGSPSFSAAPASGFTVSRPAVGTPDSSVTLKADQASQYITNTVSIPAQAVVDTDTVTPDLTVTSVQAGTTFGSNALLHECYYVSASNPKAGGAVPTCYADFTSNLTLQLYNGSAWVAVGTGSAITNGVYLRALRPGFSVEPQTVRFIAVLSGGGSEAIVRSVRNQDKVSFGPTLNVTGQILSATQYRFTYTLAGNAVTGGYKINGGSLLALTAGTGLTLTVTRPATGGTPDTYNFEATADGQTTNNSFVVTGPDQDTIPLTCTVQALGTNTDTTVVVRLSVTDPYPQGANTIFLTVGSPDVTFSPTGPSFTLTSGSPIDITITRPLLGGLPTRVTFYISAANRVSVSDGVDVLPQTLKVPGLISVVIPVQSGPSYTVNFTVKRGDGVAVVSGTNVFAAVTQIPAAGGSPTTVAYTPTYNGTNGWWTMTFTRTVNDSYFLVLSLGVDVATSRTELTVPIPVYLGAGATAAKIDTVYTQNTAVLDSGSSDGQLLLFWGITNFPSGGSVYVAYRQTNSTGAYVGGLLEVSSGTTPMILKTPTSKVSTTAGRQRMDGTVQLLNSSGIVVDSLAFVSAYFWA